MERNVKVTFRNELVDGLEMDFKTISEEWNEYQSADGSTIRIKLVMTNIVKLDKTDQDGNPIYVAKTSNVMAVSLPGKSKKGTVN
jgi:hypothetical protein